MWISSNRFSPLQQIASPSPSPQPEASTQPQQPSSEAVKREANVNIHNRVRQKRAQNIFAAPIDLNDGFQTPQYPKADAAVQFIDSALEDNFIFASLSSKERRLLIDAMMMEQAPDNDGYYQDYQGNY